MGIERPRLLVASFACVRACVCVFSARVCVEVCGGMVHAFMGIEWALFDKAALDD